MRNIGRGAIRLIRSFRLGGGGWLEKIDRPERRSRPGRQPKPPLDARQFEGFSNRADACPFGDDSLEVIRLGRGLDQHLAPDREPESGNAVWVDVGSALQICNRRVNVPDAVPPEGVRVSLASPSPRRSKSSTPYPLRARKPAAARGSFRPVMATTAARFLEGMYQPDGSRPSLVSKVTSSYAAPPMSASGTTARARWV